VQPIYVTLASAGSSPWKTTNWNATPQQISFSVLATTRSSWSVDVTFEDPSYIYPSPRSSAPTAFTIVTGSSAQFFSLNGSSAYPAPIAGYRFNAGVVSSLDTTGIALVVNQAGIG